MAIIKVLVLPKVIDLQVGARAKGLKGFPANLPPALGYEAGNWESHGIRFRI